ncbi:hypothetical protein TIFTF001_002579 [Ficus carica]|uniref:TF-B3 domain-containing protein n=1 Tax=Ficus carica TaxID=3494 RepID=A0AA87ZND8_FICCA|nr:hypothetical protein TIFTF001_002579 [Ficus carica]
MKISFFHSRKHLLSRSFFSFNTDKEGGGEKSIPPKWRKSRDLTRLQLTANDKSQALKRACDFKSKDPFFIVAMQPSYFGVKYTMNLPCPFATKYLGDKRAFVILKVGNGMTWPVIYTFGVYRKNRKAKFEYGWKAFAQDNDLKVGDVCVFVLTKSIGISFDVAIFHENETEKLVVLPVHNDAIIKVGHRGSLSNKLQSPYNMMTKKTCTSTPRRCLKELIVKGKARALEIANHFQTENPFFTFVLQASYTSAKCYFISLQFKYGRCWSVQYKVRQSLRRSCIAEFHDGWTAFAQDNNLRAGDVCIFELINGKEICFKVSIVRVADDSNDVALGKECSNPNSFEKSGNDRHPHHGLEKEEETLYSSSPLPKRRNKSPLPCSFPRKRVKTGSDHGEARRNSSHLRSKGKFKMMISEENTCGDVTTRPSTSRDTYGAANKFFSTNPYFQVALLSGHFKPTHSKVHVPVAFARTYFGERTQTVNLQVGGRSWPVKLLTNLSVYRFSRGWAAFASNNSLCPKDVLIFELIKRKSIVLKVSIFKQTGLVNCNSSNADPKNVLVID